MFGTEPDLSHHSMEICLHLTPKEIAMCVAALDVYQSFDCYEKIESDMDLDQKYMVFQMVAIMQAVKQRLKDIGGEAVEAVLEEGFVTQNQDSIS